MVRSGHAWHYEKYSSNCPSANNFAIAQQMAQEQNLGIWSSDAQPPWDWRKQNK